MPISIAKAQAEALAEGGNFGGEDRDLYGPVTLEITAKVLAQYGAEFKLKMAEYANKRKVVASGDLIDNITPVIIEQPGLTKLQIKVLDYFDYPNEGVKGVKPSGRAANSPYQFKHYKMDPVGRERIREYIRSGRAKVRNTKRDKARGIGLERKGISLEDSKVNTMIYLIKRFGIKKTNYFNAAIKDTFKDFEIIMSEAVGRDIVFTLQKLNRK